MKKEFEVTQNLYASHGQRFINYIIDIVIIYVIIFGIFSIIAVIASLTGSMGILYWMENISTLESYLIFFGVFIPYYTLMEGLYSKTIAKFITKTKVVMEDGSKPNFETTLKRTLCRIIPFEAFSFLGSGRGWHDSIPGSFVVNAKEFDTEMNQFYELDEIGKTEQK